MPRIRILQELKLQKPQNKETEIVEEKNFPAYMECSFVFHSARKFFERSRE
jgi:hypothetical protein